MLLWLTVAGTLVSVALAVKPSHMLPLSSELAQEKIVEHHSFYPPILHDAWPSTSAHWDTGLSTVVSNNYIRLTPDQPSREGYVWNEVPCRLRSWTAHVGFRVHGKGGIGGDGFAFWLSHQKHSHGGPMAGIPDHDFKGIGVVFDSFDNDARRDNPAVHVLVAGKDGANSAPEASYDDRGYRRHNMEESRGSSFNSQTDYYDERSGGCTFDFRKNYDHELMRATIAYNGDARSLEVKVGSDRNFVTCATVEDVHIPEGYYFGLSANTGGVADNHDIYYLVVSAEGGDIDAERKEFAERVGPHAERYDHAHESQEKEKWKAQN